MMIEITNLRKSFGSPSRRKRGTEASAGARVEALRGVDLKIQEPGFYGIMGPSGSGKSTLLHLLAGLDRPDAGEIVVNAAPIHALDEAALTTYRRLKIGIVFQKFNLIPTMDALTNVMLPGLLDGQPTAELTARAHALLDQFGLTARSHHRPDALSGGEQQRVAVARALLFKPGLLLADEPTGNLDSATSEQIWQMLAELATTEAMTIVMVTHEAAAAAHCREVFVLQDGHVTTQFEVEENDARWVADRYQQSQE